MLTRSPNDGPLTPMCVTNRKGRVFLGSVVALFGVLVVFGWVYGGHCVDVYSYSSQECVVNDASYIDAVGDQPPSLFLYGVMIDTDPQRSFLSRLDCGKVNALNETTCEAAYSIYPGSLYDCWSKGELVTLVEPTCNYSAYQLAIVSTVGLGLTLLWFVAALLYRRAFVKSNRTLLNDEEAGFF